MSAAPPVWSPGLYTRGERPDGDREIDRERALYICIYIYRRREWKKEGEKEKDGEAMAVVVERARGRRNEWYAGENVVPSTGEKIG